MADSGYAGRAVLVFGVVVRLRAGALFPDGVQGAGRVREQLRVALRARRLGGQLAGREPQVGERQFATLSKKWSYTAYMVLILM